MSKQDNFQINFSLKGFASIQIGIYILIAAFFIKSLLDGFLIDDSPFGMLSAELIEIFILVIAVFTFLFSSLALYFKGRRKAKRLQYQLWNSNTKSAFFKYIISFIVIFIILILLSKQGYIDFIVPCFLALYGLLLLFLKQKSQKEILILSGVCVLFALVCFFIPTYWYSSLFILGIAHITYGVVVK